MRVITFGTFDMFHYGHLKMLQRCKSYKGCDNILIVGVSSDKLNYSKKQRKPIINLFERREIVKNIKCVDDVFTEHSLEDKLKYCQFYNADVMIIGDDHKGRFDFLREYGIEVEYLSRTDSISTTALIEKIQIGGSS